VLNLDISTFPDPGLYLLLPDGERLVLTRKSIEKTTRAMLDAPEIIPEHVRAATEYKPCDICPERDRAEICHAIMPTLPFFDDIDRYMSYDMVTAVYREGEEEVFVVCNARMADALQFVTILSLMSYCEVGQQYERYFEGINPLMPVDKIGKAVFLNIYLESEGDVGCVENVITKMSENILHTARCQTARLNLICKRDSFINAFVNTDLIFQYIKNELRHHIEKTSESS